MEKFALLNLLKAFETLTSAGSQQSDAPRDDGQGENRETSRNFMQNSAQVNAQQSAAPNMMASVLARHEQISNRIKSRRN